MNPVNGGPIFLQKEPGVPWICILKICVLYLVWGRVFLFSPERSSLPCFPHPSWLLGVSGRMRLPGETKAQGGPPWQIVLSFSIPVRFAI